jgi:hypothetical protein
MITVSMCSVDMVPPAVGWCPEARRTAAVLASVRMPNRVRAG